MIPFVRTTIGGGHQPLQITLDQQTVSRECLDCGGPFTVVRGSVYGGGQPIGLYLIALHGHTPQGRLAHLAVAIAKTSIRRPIAMALEVVEAPDQVGFRLVDWSRSPWKSESYLGEMLDRNAALHHQNKALVVHVAEHVMKDLPEVQRYFAEERGEEL